MNRTGDPDRRPRPALLPELDGLPLALEEAGTYIQATADTLAGYLGMFQERRPGLLDRAR